MDETERPARADAPVETPQPVARVNIHPDDSGDVSYPAAGSPAALSAEREVHGAWGIPALGLGVVAIIIIVVALILILQGVFRMMPN